ncbi:hypothetical protein F5Y06DRAFT_297480 [Hypoxylon sp. FL0890]|nr:hypothetical protein F5Y06DRAFT_297480 [Hypoxylon sp. FL0890]
MSTVDLKAWAKENPNPHVSGYPIHDAIESCATDVIKIEWAEQALAAGEDINRLHLRKGRPLNLALKERDLIDAHTGISVKHVERAGMIMWLIANGADPRLRDQDRGLTPMDEALLIIEAKKKKGEPIEFWAYAQELMVDAAKKHEEREAAEKKKQPATQRVASHVKEFFTRDPDDDKCALCRCLPARREKPPKDCPHCKEQKAYHWHYPRVEIPQLSPPAESPIV